MGAPVQGDGCRVPVQGDGWWHAGRAGPPAAPRPPVPAPVSRGPRGRITGGLLSPSGPHWAGQSRPSCMDQCGGRPDGNRTGTHTVAHT